MDIRPDTLQKPVNKFREAILHLPEDPSVEDVHQLRTQARRLEAIAAAIMLDKERETQQLLKEVKTLRRAAGKVRDLDVLAANAVTLASDGEKDSVVRLIERLGAMRIERAKNLYDMVAVRQGDVRRGLKQFSKKIQKEVDKVDTETRSGSNDDSSTRETIKTIWEITDELARWQKLGRKTIHSFRIKVKKLRYILELFDGSDPEFMYALGEVKDKIGNWHDWDELAEMAEAVLDAEIDGALLRRIQEVGKTRLKTAVVAAQTMQSRYLGSDVQRSPRKQPGRKPPGSVRLEVPAVELLAGVSGTGRQ